MSTNPLHDLLPHRGPMLLLDQIVDVTDREAKAAITIRAQSSFCVAERGVPAWVGLEYMGQTAALIAGLQLNKGVISPHLGMLLGTRQYRCSQAWFAIGDRLMVHCWEHATVGEGLATFNAQIHSADQELTLASAKLTVFRKPLDEQGA